MMSVWSGTRLLSWYTLSSGISQLKEIRDCQVLGLTIRRNLLHLGSKAKELTTPSVISVSLANRLIPRSLLVPRCTLTTTVSSWILSERESNFKTKTEGY